MGTGTYNKAEKLQAVHSPPYHDMLVLQLTAIRRKQVRNKTSEIQY